MDLKTFTSLNRAAYRENPDHAALLRRGYKISRKIGQGSFSQVHFTLFTDPSTGEQHKFACKTIDKSKANQEYLDKFLPREIEILAKISHPNIIDLNCILQRNNKIFIFMR